MSSPHLGVWLVTLGFISRRQLGTALETEMATGAPLADVLVSQQLLTEAVIQGAYELQVRLSRAGTLGELGIEPEVLSLLPVAIANREKVLPLCRIADRLVVAYARSRSRHEEVSILLDAIGQTTGLSVHGIPFPPDELEAAIADAYGALATTGLVDRAMQKVIPKQAASARATIEVADASEEAPVVDLVNQLLRKAVERGASDLHFKPTETAFEVQMRLDGVMQPLMTLPKAVEGAIVSRLKVMADLNIAERRRPQDGRVSIHVAGVPIDLRVAVVATHFGEWMVLRILRPLAVPEGFGGLGFSPEAASAWSRVVGAPNGLILVTGPTGSGKTSTLYATLAQFDRRERNILTVEDPVEYPVSGIGQIQAAPQVGLTFAAALRSILRLDPDVILIGEIRDRETLNIALEAAQTGHLVLSTLHTNDAVSAVGRMVEMGASPHLVASTLVGVLAQRLVRRLCTECRRFVAPEADEAAFVDGCERLGVPVGCDACGGIGYRGRMGVYEILENHLELAELIAEEASGQELWRQARQFGMATLLADGKAKARAGATSVAEVQRVLGVLEAGAQPAEAMRP